MTEYLHFHLSLSCIGEGNGNPFQCSCLENPRDRGAWWAAVYGVAQSQTQLKRLSSSSSSIVNEAGVFSGILLLFLWSNRCWQFGLWFLCLSSIQLEHLEVLSSRTVEDQLGEFWALLCQCVRWVQLCGSLNSLALPFFGTGMKTDLFQSCIHCWVFQICWLLTAELLEHHLLGFEKAKLEFHHLH